MFFKNPFRKPYFTKEFYIVLIIAALIIIFTAILLRPASALKGEQVELRQSGGEYDGAVLITRDSNNNLNFFVVSGSVKIKDGGITLSGVLRVDGTGIGSSAMGSAIMFVNPNIVFQNPLLTNANITLGWDGNSYELWLLDPDGNIIIELNGTSGHATFKGGVNVGSSTGAGTGDIKASDQISALSFSDGHILWTAAQMNRPGNKIELQYGATSGSQVRIGGSGSYPVTFDANNGDASGMRSIEFANYSGGKPAASAALRGTIVYEYGGVGVGDLIFCCMKDTGDGYQWVLLKGAP